jgi:hypothetical protein
MPYQCRTNPTHILYLYAHVHSPAVSDCSVSAQGLVHFSPKPPVLAPSLRLHAAVCGHRERTAALFDFKLLQLINYPASGAHIGLVPFYSACLVSSGLAPFTGSCSASRWSQLPTPPSLIRTFYKPGPLPARHLALGEPPSFWSLTFNFVLQPFHDSRKSLSFHRMGGARDLQYPTPLRYRHSFVK